MATASYFFIDFVQIQIIPIVILLFDGDTVFKKWLFMGSAQMCFLCWHQSLKLTKPLSMSFMFRPPVKAGFCKFIRKMKRKKKSVFLAIGNNRNLYIDVQFYGC